MHSIDLGSDRHMRHVAGRAASIQLELLEVEGREYNYEAL